MPFSRTRAVMVAGIALLAGPAMYGDAVAQGLVANPPYRCWGPPRVGACRPTPTFPHPHTYQYQHTFQSPFSQQSRAAQCPPGYYRAAYGGCARYR
jgi:hypothetical protein